MKLGELAWVKEKDSGLNCHCLYIGTQLVGRVFESPFNEEHAWQLLLPRNSGGIIAGRTKDFERAQERVEAETEEWFDGLRRQNSNVLRNRERTIRGRERTIKD
jgi:hypothetical protein